MYRGLTLTLPRLASKASSTIRQPSRDNLFRSDETRIIALRALRELLDDAGPDDWDDLVASYSALNNAITKKKPMTRKDRARVAEHLRRLGWRERAIGAATAQADAHAGTGHAATNELEGRWLNPVEGAATPYPQRRGATWFQRQQGATPAG
jgi:hypothetical protein